MLHHYYESLYYRVRQGFECGDTNLKQGEQGTIGHQFLMSPLAEFIPSLANIKHVAYTFPAPYVCQIKASILLIESKSIIMLIL